MPVTTASHEPRWHRRKDERPGEILRAALASFVERGYADTRLEDVARAAGCTKGTIFLYYENKAELFKAAMRAAMLPLLQASEQAVEEHRGSVREVLEALLRMRFDRLMNTDLSGLARLMFGESAKFPELARFYHDEILQRTLALFTRLLQQGIERGEFRPHDCEQAARVALAPMLMFSLWKHSFAGVVEPAVDASACFETALDLFLRGIAAPSPETSS
jgi:AcrR family transcriptional regulator